MVKLFCAIVGTKGSVFSVRVDEDDSVDDLKKAIKAENATTITSDAKDLQLFLAKKDEGRGAWLTEADVKNGVEDTTGLKLLDAVRARLRRVGLSDKDVGGVDEEEEAEGRGPVNVLVVVPESLGVDSQLLQLQEALLQHTLVDSPTSTSAQSYDFKASLIRTYQCDMGTYQDDMENRMLRCMLLNTALPSGLVIASHLFRRKNEYISRKLMGFDNIDDVKNGLLLFKPLEHAFDHFQISFIYDKGSNEFPRSSASRPKTVEALETTWPKACTWY
ncbi:unnamed protein product [Phytophthora lilii]|uniref:Unnamed protein product n=1 Tax=Phytophthora lilii TaxID=2077276 RepID=A0A9W6TYB6_9STRA|nr:unnamed protein product [Phytophthora lilii]